jgi:Tfp pilus assembly protein PilV
VHAEHPRRGVALLDVVIALVVLGLSGVAFVNLLGQTSHSMRSIRNTERLTRRASDELGRFVIYDRAQLIAMSGRSVSRGWMITVEQIAPALFDVAIASVDNSTPLLETTLYRPDTSRAEFP